jgi:hypothetical protein
MRFSFSILCIFATTACDSPAPDICPRGWHQVEALGNDFADSHCEPSTEYVSEISARPGAWIYGYVSESECNDGGSEGECGGWSETAILTQHEFELVDAEAQTPPPEPAARVVTNADGTFEIALPPGVRYRPAVPGAWLPMEGVEPISGQAQLLAVTYYRRE